MPKNKESDDLTFTIKDYEYQDDYSMSFNFEPLSTPDFTISFIDYAFNEKALLEEMKEYIDSTYDAHYSQDKYQSTEIIEDMGHGMGFALET